MKRIICLFLAALIAVTFAGCSNFLDTDYKSSTPHVNIKDEQSQTDASPDTEITIEKGDAAALTDAVSTLIHSGHSYGIIRVAAYDGNLEADAERVCLGVAYNSPYGSYAVQNVSYSVNKFVSYSEVRVHIAYNDGIEAYKDISQVSGKTAAIALLENTLRGYGRKFVVYTASSEITAEAMLHAVEDIYYSGKIWFAVMPEISARSFPEEGDSRIIELRFEYPYSDYRMNSMRSKTGSAVNELVTQLAALEDWDALLELSRNLSESCRYAGDPNDDEYDRGSVDYTAYGALALRRAAGEGYAMAVQLLCNDLGIECMVVRGRHNNMAHTWNIVKVGNEYYHLDTSLMAELGEDNVFLMDDSHFSVNYYWDVSLYPACTDNRLGDIVVAPAPTEPPAEGDTEGTGEKADTPKEGEDMSEQAEEAPGEGEEAPGEGEEAPGENEDTPGESGSAA